MGKKIEELDEELNKELDDVKSANAKSTDKRSWALKGIGGKPLFDWLGLFIQGTVPILLAALTWVQTDIANERNERDKALAKDTEMQAIMAGYLTQMTNLILKEDLQKAAKDSKAAIMARAITLNASRQLDEDRKGQLLKFLYEANLIGRCLPTPQEDQCTPPILDLSGIKLESTTFNPPIPLLGIELTGASLPSASLEGIDLTKADMSKVNLSCADLNNSFLKKVDLEGANLTRSKIAYASLPEAILESALLQGANLEGANLERASLDGADLKGANLQSANLKAAQLGVKPLPNGKSAITNLAGANLAGANLAGANLTGANFKNALYSQETKFPSGFDPDQQEMHLLNKGQANPRQQQLTKRLPQTEQQCELQS